MDNSLCSSCQAFAVVDNEVQSYTKPSLSTSPTNGLKTHQIASLLHHLTHDCNQYCQEGHGVEHDTPCARVSIDCVDCQERKEKVSPARQLKGGCIRNVAFKWLLWKFKALKQGSAFETNTAAWRMGCVRAPINVAELCSLHVQGK